MDTERGSSSAGSVLFLEALLDQELGEIRDDVPGDLAHNFVGYLFDDPPCDGVNVFGRQTIHLCTLLNILASLIECA